MFTFLEKTVIHL